MKYSQAPVWTSCRKAASWVSSAFQLWTTVDLSTVGQREARDVDGVAEGVLGQPRSGHVVYPSAAVGAEDVDGRDPLAEAGLRVGLDDGVQPGLQRRNHWAVDGQGLVDPDRAIIDGRNLQRTRHAADARTVDFGRGDYGV